MNQQINSDRQRGLYRSEFEHDNCGVGMVANLSGEASHDIVVSGVTILKRLLHRGATGNDPETGDGAGLLLKIPQRFFQKKLEEICSHKERKEHKGKGCDVFANFAANGSTPFGIAMIFGGEGKRRRLKKSSRVKGVKSWHGGMCRSILRPSARMLVA